MRKEFLLTSNTWLIVYLIISIESLNRADQIEEYSSLLRKQMRDMLFMEKRMKEVSLEDSPSLKASIAKVNLD